MERVPELLEPENQIMDACIAIANIVRAVKNDIGTEKISVTVRISPDGTHVSVDPWEPIESDAVALINALAGKVVEIREKTDEVSGDADGA